MKKLNIFIVLMCCTTLVTAQSNKVLQQGLIVDFKVNVISQPNYPDSTTSTARISMQLTVVPKRPGSIRAINIEFVKDADTYPPVVYKSPAAYVTKPMSQYQPLLDLLKMKLAKDYVGQPIGFQLSTNGVYNNILTID
ncbi:hypothetical protein ACFOWM_09240 [Ferruginibacter yonginensis]|uniref:Uncharacterized protein n=1 Tax=Ferruginibacter yonginensis TaxID=1310416 RepID=A0ABV8QRY5_9BACT